MRVEVAEARWLPLDEAPRLLAYGGEREMARRRAIDSARERARQRRATTSSAAAATVDPKVWCYFEGGAGDEVTLRANVAAFGRWRLRPRMLVDVAEVSTATTRARDAGLDAAARRAVRDAAAARPGGRGGDGARRAPPPGR